MKKECKYNKIYILGYIGIYGTFEIIKKKSDELITHFSYDYLLDSEKSLKKIINDNKKNIDCVKEYLINNDSEFFDIGKGGFLSILWQMGEVINSGFIYNLSKVPIKQVCIEIADFFDINVYRLYSKNSIIILSNDDIINDMIDSNLIDIKYFPVNNIGYLTDEKKRIRIDNISQSYLTKDYKDDIDLVIKNYTKMKRC